MKARLFFTPLAAVIGALILYLAIAGIGKADDPPAPDPYPLEIQGKDVGQWHAVAARYLHSVRALNHTAPPWGNSSLESAFFCIHSHEGRWSDPGAPYWGGLQMDKSFQRSYGGWALRAFGTADHWPVSVQLAVAIRAKVSGRGFYPWPNTARYCGLL